MKFGVILETKEPEKAWNGFRFANASRKAGHEVKVFLMGEGVECERLPEEPFDVAAQIRQFTGSLGIVMACGTCLNARDLKGTASCPSSTMADCVAMVAWADRVVTF